MIPYVNISVVQADEHPRLTRMKVGALHAVRPRRQLAFYIQPQRLANIHHNNIHDDYFQVFYVLDNSHIRDMLKAKTGHDSGTTYREL